MLEKQPWIRYADDLQMDWRHALEEGKDVEGLKEECKHISELPLDNPQRNILADEIYQKLQDAPAKEGFQYKEPSDLIGIKNLRPEKRVKINKAISRDKLFDKVYGAWLGRVAGCLLGKPIEGWYKPRLDKLLQVTGNYPLNRFISSDIPLEVKKDLDMDETRPWIDKVAGKAPFDDDTNYTIMGLKILETYGRTFTNHDIAEAWITYMPYTSACTAERVAYKNIAAGIFPPYSASYKNPFREWIGAQIRADFYGWINPGNPEIAAEMAWRDASISHTRNGIYGEMFVAAMLAAAAVTDDMMTIIETGLGEIPEHCRLTEKIRLVLSWYRQGVAAEVAIYKIHELYDEKNAHDWCHTISNAMIVVLGLLYGGKDYEKSICLAVQSAFDTDCNGATVGSIVGMVIGASAVPEKWKSPMNDLLESTIQGYETVRLSEMAKKTLEFIEG